MDINRGLACIRNICVNLGLPVRRSHVSGPPSGFAGLCMPIRPRCGARHRCSNLLVLAGALELAAQARSAWLGRSNHSASPQNRCSSLIGALAMAAPARSTSLGRPSDFGNLKTHKPQGILFIKPILRLYYARDAFLHFLFVAPILGTRKNKLDESRKT